MCVSLVVFAAGARLRCSDVPLSKRVKGDYTARGGGLGERLGGLKTPSLGGGYVLAVDVGIFTLFQTFGIG
jgi:hypothetical protein